MVECIPYHGSGKGSEYNILVWDMISQGLGDDNALVRLRLSNFPFGFSGYYSLLYYIYFVKNSFRLRVYQFSMIHPRIYGGHSDETLTSIQPYDSD
jgi:hypothetical protein